MKCLKFAVSASTERKKAWGGGERGKILCKVLVSYNQLLQGDMNVIILIGPFF